MGSSQQIRTGRAMRIVVGVFGLLAALAAMEHGLGEILQGPVAPDGLVMPFVPVAASQLSARRFLRGSETVPRTRLPCRRAGG